MEVWNQWLGVTFFVVSADMTKADIFIWDAPRTGNNLGVTRWRVVPDSVRSKYRYAVLPVITMFVHDHAVLTHELGHAIGLAHDKKNRRSIMYPYMNGMYVPRLEGRDKAALRRVYKF